MFFVKIYSFSLTSLANEINGFLTNETINANRNYTRYDRLIRTYQNTIAGTRQWSTYDPDPGNDPSLVSLQNSVINGSYESWVRTNGISDEWYQSSNPDDPFQSIAEPRKGILTAILSENMGHLRDRINEQLGGGFRTVAEGSTITANI